MKITRERKIIGGVLLLAIAGFAFDRMSPGADATTGADPGSLLIASNASSNKTTSSSLNDNGSNQPSLSDRLTKLSSGQAPSRDVFRPGTSWTPVSVVTVATDNSRAEVIKKFTQTHKLTTVSLNAQRGGAAIIDGKLIHVGGMVDGYKLIAVTHQSATFDAGDGSAMQLRMNGQ